MRTDGETFQPWPRSRARLGAGALRWPCPPSPFSPVKFSGLIERDLGARQPAQIGEAGDQPVERPCRRIRLGGGVTRDEKSSRSERGEEGAAANHNHLRYGVRHRQGFGATYLNILDSARGPTSNTVSKECP